MDTDRWPLFQRIGDAVDITNRRRDQVDLPLFHAMLTGRPEFSRGRVLHELLTDLGPSQHPDHSPDSVIVDRRVLPGTPDKAHDRKTFLRIAVEQVLPVTFRIGRSERIRQPVVMRDKFNQQGLALRQDAFLVLAALLDKTRHRLYEVP